MEDQHRSYNSYYTVRGAKQLEESSNWRRGSVSWDSQNNTERHPNFDYHSNYSRTEPNHNQIYPRYEEESTRNSYELDPRTMEFDRLVELLHPKFISEYLNKILCFLRSDNREICFPNIAPYKEAFLVRIASNYKNLDCPVFDDICRNLCKNIQECLNRNSDLYLWKHYFESGQSSKSILVYKKVYINSHCQQNDIYVPEVNYTTKPRSSSLDSEIDRSSRPSQSTNRNDIVSTDFKIQSIKIILDFIKDDNRFVLDYPNLSETQSNFLYNLLWCYDKPNYDEKSLLCSPLIETLKLFSMKYHFRVGVKDNIKDKCIVLEKVPRSKLSMSSLNDSLKSPSPSVMESQDLEDWHTDVENSDTTDQRSDVMSDFGSNKNRRKMKYLFDNVTTEFKISAMQASLAYLQDDSRPSLEFVSLTLEESKFLKCLNSFPMARRMRGLIEKQCLPLVMKLRRILEVVKQRYKLRIVIHVHPNNKLSNVEMTKLPKKERRKRKNAERKRRSGNTDASRPSDKAEFVSPREKFLKALSLSSDSDGEFNKSRHAQPSGSQYKSEPKSSTKDIDKTSDRDQKNSTLSSIQWQPASAEAANGVVEACAGAGKEKGRLTRHKTKLLQAMSVPVESDKAVRMMRLMGWEGGALGRHGDGITVPIIPAIELITGAGLGHTPNQATSKKEGGKESKKGVARTAVSFRREFLDNVLDLLRKQDLGEKEIVYERPLSKKEKRFTNSSVEALNKRRNLGLNSTEEKDYVCRILANLNTMHNLSLAVEFSGNQKQINIIKNVSTSRRKHRKLSIDRTSEDDVIETPSIDGNTVTNCDIKKTMTQMMGSKNGNSYSRTIRTRALKCIILNKILEFVTDKGVDLNLGFEETLTSKHCQYLEAVVQNLNKKVKFHCGGNTENDLYYKIKRRMDCLLKLSVCEKTYRRLTIKKMYYQKRFINTANSPKSNTEAESKVDHSLGADSECESTDLQADLNALIVNDIDTDKESVNADQTDPCSEKDLNSILDQKHKESVEKDKASIDEKDQASVEIDHKFITVDETDQYSSTDHRNISTDEKDLDFMIIDEMGHEYITVDEIGSEIEIDALESSQSLDSDSAIPEEMDTNKDLFAKEELTENEDIKEDLDETLLLDNNNEMEEISEFSPIVYDEVLDENKNHDMTKSVQLHNAVKIEDAIAMDVCTEKVVKVEETSNSNENNCKNSTPLQRAVKEENTTTNYECTERLVPEENIIVFKTEEINIPVEELITLQDLVKEEANDDSKEKLDSTLTEEEIEVKMEEKNYLEELEELVPELSPGSKRSREDSESSDIQISKKTKIYIEDILKVNIAIIPTDYPDSKLNLETVKIIQNDILTCFNDIKDDFLPCLKCDGIIDGALKFVCKNYESYLWLKRRVTDIVLPGLELKLVHFTEKSENFQRKMVLSLRSYIKEDAKNLFERLEKLNKWIVTKNWMILNEFWDENNGLWNIILQVDENSYSEMEKRNFSVNTGFDVGVFSEI